MFHATRHVTGGILWANLHLLFWLSLFPFTTALGGRESSRADAHGGLWLRAADGGHRVLYFAARHHRPARPRLPARGGHRQGLERQTFAAVLISPPFRWRSSARGFPTACIVFVALMWLVPDRRIERVLSTSRYPDRPHGFKVFFQHGAGPLGHIVENFLFDGVQEAPFKATATSSEVISFKRTCMPLSSTFRRSSKVNMSCLIRSARAGSAS